MANPARGLLNREKKKEENVNSLAAQPPVGARFPQKMNLSVFDSGGGGGGHFSALFCIVSNFMYAPSHPQYGGVLAVSHRKPSRQATSADLLTIHGVKCRITCLRATLRGLENVLCTFDDFVGWAAYQIVFLCSL